MHLLGRGARLLNEPSGCCALVHAQNLTRQARHVSHGCRHNLTDFQLGCQSLNFGLVNLDTFAWVGGFSSSPNTMPPAQLVRDAAAARQKLKLLWVSCGDQDSLFNISEGVHNYLVEQKVPHIWHVDVGGAHTFPVWKNDLYHFSTLLFR